MSAVFVYQVTLRRTVQRWIGWGSEDANFERFFQLTFAPYPGLYISGDNEFQEQITEVVYDSVEGTFDCSCGNRSVYDYARTRNVPENDTAAIEAIFTELVEEQLANGWERVDT